jgi:hypothetical protein
MKPDADPGGTIYDGPESPEFNVHPEAMRDHPSPTLRDQFAMAALQGILANGTMNTKYVEEAFEAADKCMEVRDARSK